jgi:hypothetical protein
VTSPPAPVPGPTAAAVAGLRDWLSRAVGDEVTVRVGTASGPGERDQVWVRPVALLGDQSVRGGGGRSPLRFRLRHLVTVAGPVESTLDVLDRVLVALAAEDRYRLVLEPVPEGVWGLLVDVPVQVVAPEERVPRVRGELRVDDVPLGTVRGRLLGPGDVPLAGMTVTSVATGTSVTAGPRGDFTLPGQPAGRTVALRLTGRGPHQQVDVPPSTDPVVIHCDIQEV